MNAKSNVRVTQAVRNNFINSKPRGMTSSEFLDLILTMWQTELENRHIRERLAEGLHPLISVPGDSDFIAVEGDDFSKVDTDELKDIWARFEYLLTRRVSARGRPKGVKETKPRKARQSKLPLLVGASK